MGKQKKTKYVWEEKYKEVCELGRGGNAIVLLVQNKERQKYAIKILEDKKDKVKTSRFIDEIKIMDKLRNISGVIPILESNTDEYWYVMPVAEPIMDHLEGCENRIGEIKRAVKQLTVTLFQMQKLHIAHRDIKPGNLYYYDKRYCIGDFGLVDFPEHVKDLTDAYRNMGAKFTIAPEMMRYPKEADGLKADIYSMAKSIWMLLTRDELGFEGVYNYLDESHGLRYRKELEGEHLAELEQLLHNATSNAPEDRPSIEEFQGEIKNWIKISNNEELAQESDWKFLAKLIFGNRIPKSSVWDNIDDIVFILNLISSIPAYNHMFLPVSGGMDLKKVWGSKEKGWINMQVEWGFVYRLKPKCLIFESFGDEIEWNYFRLELYEAVPILESTKNSEFYEYLTEDYEGHYIKDMGLLDKGGEKYQVRRYVRGTFLIVMKYGLYNSISSAYDGRHGDCNNSEFRRYIETLIGISHKVKDAGGDPEQVLNNVKDFYKNPFRA